MKKKSKKSYPKLPKYPEGGKFSYPTYQKIDDKYYTTNVDMTPQDFTSIDRTGMNKIGLDPRNRDLKELTEADYNRLAPVGSANRFGDYKSPKAPVIPMQLAEKGIPTITTDGAGNKYYKDARGNFIKPEEYANYRNGGRVLPKFYNGVDEFNPADPNRIKGGVDNDSAFNMSNMSAGQYATMGAGALQGGSTISSAYSNPEATDSEKGTAIGEGAYQAGTGVVTAINPVVGGLMGAVGKFGKDQRIKNEAIDEEGNLVDREKAVRGHTIGTFTSPSKALSNVMTDSDASVGRKIAAGVTGGISEAAFGNKYADKLEKDAKAKIADENYATSQYKREQDQFNEKINQMQNPTYGYGGYGIPKGVYPNGGMPNAEVEKQEMMRMPDGSTEQVNGPSHEQGGVPVNIPTGTQIYSDRLKHPETGKTFAKEAGKYKIIEAKNGGTLSPTQKLINDVRQKKLDSIFQAQEKLKQDKVNNYARKMGITLPQPSMDNEVLEPKGLSEASEGEYAYGGTNFGREVTMGYQDPRVTGGIDITNPSSIQDPTQMYVGGGLKRSEDYGSKENPYPSVASNDFAGSHRSYPIPTKADAVDALRLAGMHGRSDVKAKVYSKYPSLKHADGGIQPELTDEGYVPTDFKYDFDPFLKSNQGIVPQQSTNDYSDEVGLGANIIGQNVGNIYDLAQTRFGKKYDKEDFGRVNPKYLDATESLRDADIQANVSRARLKDLTGGNAGAYLANLSGTQTANTLNKAKIREAIDQANVGIYNVADEKNLSLKNAAKMAEQQNKARSEDIARQAISSTGQNTASAIRDYKLGKRDQESLKIIGQAYPNYQYNPKTKTWEHKVTKEKLKV